MPPTIPWIAFSELTRRETLDEEEQRSERSSKREKAFGDKQDIIKECYDPKEVWAAMRA